MEASGSPVPYNDIQIMSDVKQIGGSGIFDETFPGRELAGEMYCWTSWEQKPEIYEVLEKIAVRDFGEKAALKIIEAWKQISYGASKIPACSLHVGQSLIHNTPYLSLYPVSDPRTSFL